MINWLKRWFAGLFLGQALKKTDDAPDLIASVNLRQERAPTVARVQQRITQSQIELRLREIYRCDQFGWPLPPGMTEMECYEAACELDGDVAVGGVVLSDENRRAMDEAEYAISLAKRECVNTIFGNEGRELLLNEDPAEYRCQKCGGCCGGLLCEHVEHI